MANLKDIARALGVSVSTVSRALNEQGITVTHLSDEDMELIRQTCLETYLEECEINPNFKMVYDSMQAYRATADNYRDWTGDYGFGFNREA